MITSVPRKLKHASGLISCLPTWTGAKASLGATHKPSTKPILEHARLGRWSCTMLWARLKHTTPGGLSSGGTQRGSGLVRRNVGRGWLCLLGKRPHPGNKGSCTGVERAARARTKTMEKNELTTHVDHRSRGSRRPAPETWRRKTARSSSSRQARTHTCTHPLTDASFRAAQQSHR